MSMSHRTAPFYGSVRRDQSGISASASRSAKTPECIFYALQHGLFDWVRQAVEADASILHVRGGVRGTATPLEHALNLAFRWCSLLAHCERTGGAGLAAARQRVAAMAELIKWLAAQPGAPPAPRDALHTTIACNYEHVTRKLVACEPVLAVCAIGVRNRTPMHAAMRLAARLSPASTLAYVRLLRDAGASFEARDVYGCTPLHELVITLAVSRRARALEGTRVHRPSLRRVQSTIEFALLEGADLFAVDRRGVTPFDIAVREHLDYLVLVRAAHFIYTNICKNSQREAMDGRMGMFEALPHDIILRIVSCLSPRDAVTGIGASCKALNELVRSKYLWKHLSTFRSL